MESTHSATVSRLQEQLKQSEANRLQLQQQLEQTQDELRECKEFFGYDSDMSIQEMEKYKNECEEDEKILRETDQEYANQCERSDEISELVVILGEYQYAVAELYEELRKLSPQHGGINLRKNFTSDFIALKDSIPDENVSKFFNIIIQWIHLQYKIHVVDKKITDSIA